MPKRRLGLAPRNDPLGLAQRGWANLLLIEKEYSENLHGHVITQLLQSLLTLVIFPKEKEFFEYVSHCTLDDLEKTGWPRPRQIVGETNTLAELFTHMRNAAIDALTNPYARSRLASWIVVTP